MGQPAAEEQNRDPSTRVSHPGENGWEPSLAQDDSFLLHLRQRTAKGGHPRQFLGIHGSDERKIVMRSLRFLFLFLLVGSLHSAFAAEKPSNQSGKWKAVEDA